tara:strand:- start:1301 stop:1492 length:192 start_codon:yes stop_codon:yes gene_type:complete
MLVKLKTIEGRDMLLDPERIALTISTKSGNVIVLFDNDLRLEVDMKQEDFEKRLRHANVKILV